MYCDLPFDVLIQITDYKVNEKPNADEVCPDGQASSFASSTANNLTQESSVPSSNTGGLENSIVDIAVPLLSELDVPVPSSEHVLNPSPSVSLNNTSSNTLSLESGMCTM